MIMHYVHFAQSHSSLFTDSVTSNTVNNINYEVSQYSGTQMLQLKSQDADPIHKYNLMLTLKQ
jgi:hypothetical protein